MKQQTAKKTIAATLALSIATMPALSWSGWVDDWMTQKTSTSPSYYEGAKRGYYTGGSFSARWPNGTDYPVTVTMPSIKSGCGGIDAFLGGFSFMNVDYLVQKLQRILSAAPAAAFDIAMKTLAPQVSDTIKSLEAIADRLNNIQLNDCKAAKALVAVASEPFSPIMSQSVKNEMSNSMNDFMVSSGVNDLYQTSKTNLTAVMNSAMGNAPPVGNVVAQASQGGTAGCPSDITDIFGGGSVLDNLATKKGMNANYVKLIRGFIGDVVVQSPTTTNSTYVASYIPPCDKNTDFDTFIDGSAQGKDSAGVCSTITDANANLMQYVSTRMQTISTKMKAKQTLDAANDVPFLNATPLSISLVLKTAIATNTEGEVIGKLSAVTARAFAYYMLLDLLQEATQLQNLSAQIQSQNKDNKAGASPSSCQLALLFDGMKNVDQLTNRTRVLLTTAQQGYANVVNEMNAIEMLVLTMKRFDDTVFSELAGRFGTGVARRATGRS
ncbi:conjugal transfer protein TraH [Geobacter argillaceus]|uniref:Conjugative transfer pilus assembly protein TraH n=1 Tax=Geobacter argillaceus TaxID=345631 RepID=A0A562VP07_9BACT|nr:conjugal transfer protein TraH [Geobacter argillaceus]TWJ19723.1 conjugative transfer pilus assembly protein TraH [Geobacter argillaceus]